MKKLSLRFISRREGYSLIEIVLSIAILLIISMILTSILGVSQKALNKIYLNQNANSEMSYAIEYIKDEIDSCDYYALINGKIYFIKKMGNKYNYINYEKKTNQLYRVSNTVNTLLNKINTSSGIKNSMTGEIKSFKISDCGNYFNIYLEYRNRDKINFKVAKRIPIYE
ncbi:PulJ/GspJ family protein [Peptoniphilus porci]|uniref:Prepilin-type N-terminal cleavage/methylation domain-containing protein n=1 Tax=Peptoniphilus porci TaxID=2652280 RepID=A0A1U7M1Y4_9FIRM|nr:type II secretion system protein [Peptoniphilus porci]OLR65682.1 prepilin-type N-terminal cleavage/methylation domain-containing protein [Peptoniphilus porci]